MAKSPLGRGLSALLSGSSTNKPKAPDPPQEPTPPPPPAAETASASPGPAELRMDQIQPCSFQPRKDFDETSLQELADSIASQGIVQPLVVRPQGEGYELIAGERRWRAAQKAGLETVPAIIRNADDREVVELALVENLQRENLNPIEEAVGFQQLIQQFKLRQEQAAQKVGKSRAAVANALRLLKLPDKVQELLKEGDLSVGHAKVILGLSTKEEKLSVARRVVKDGLSVRETEVLVGKRLPQTEKAETEEPTKTPSNRDPHLTKLEERVCQKLSTKVAIKYRDGKGSVELKFFSDEDLERLVHLLGVESD